MTQIDKFLERETMAKSLITFIQAQLNILKSKKDEFKEGFSYSEVINMWEDLLDKGKELNELKTKIVELELVGWKGKDNIEVYKFFDNTFVLKEHRKDKETGDVVSVTHEIPPEKVNRLLNWINRWKVGETHKCYDFALFLGYSSWKDLWRERKIYFSDYYFPIKILEIIGVITYSGRGTIQRFK